MGKKSGESKIESKAYRKRTVSLVPMKPLRKSGVYKGDYSFCPKGYTHQEFDLYREEYERIQEVPLEELKSILALNGHLFPASLDKQQAVELCADGYALGSIPICPNCYGSTPVYNKKTGVYLCSGYREDSKFIKCNTQFERSEVKRGLWNDNFEERERNREKRSAGKIRMSKRWNVIQRRKKAIEEGCLNPDEKLTYDERQLIATKKKHRYDTSYIERVAQLRKEFNLEGSREDSEGNMIKQQQSLYSQSEVESSEDEEDQEDDLSAQGK